MRSRVDVVRRRPSQCSVEMAGTSGAIMRRTVEQRRCMQWWVERRTWVEEKGGC
jgi:hypothetical protein